MQDVLAVVILDDDPEPLRVPVRLLVPLEVGGQRKVNLERRPRDGLHVRAQLDARELVHELVNRLAHLGETNQLANLLAGQVVVPLPRQVLAFHLGQDVRGDALELAQRRLRAPRAPRRHLAQRQRLIRERRPPPLEHNLEDTPQDAPGALSDVHHVRHQREPLELHPADVRLEQDVDLRRRLLDALLDRDRHALGELRELQLLLLAHGDVLELLRQREQPAQLDVAHGRFQVLVERLHRAVRDVVVARDLPQIRRLQSAAPAVVPAQSGFIQTRGGGVHQIGATLFERGVLLQRVHPDAVQVGVAQHAHVEVGVPQPRHGFARARHRPENNLRVERVREVSNELRLDRQLLVEQRQVVLQLAVLRDDDALAEGVELRPAGAAHHLHHVLETQLVPPPFFGVIHLRSLDDHSVRGQVHAPRQRRRAH
mmetsp:Transcript_11887/g.50962  ORF Transcript_11887/g.50962 Transcript_11887/m.50962 type:complete len:427 (-) Transcript_11887:2664-3944(-)